VRLWQEANAASNEKWWHEVLGGNAFMSSKPDLERHSTSVENVPVQTAGIGLVLLDSFLNPVYCNSEALRILAYPNRPTKTTILGFLSSLRSIVGNNDGVNDFVKTFRIVSGRRRYICRIFMPETDSGGGFPSTIVITLERDRSLLHELVARFQLTDRESEAVQYLAQGLTSKEIAQQMNISVNTVKVFLRLIMIKMGVTNRSGIVGKLVHGIDSDN
jgi:DNA-binding CsgD family transcriptional regulator